MSLPPDEMPTRAPIGALESIKIRAEVNQYLGKTASQDEAKDTLKLVAALEAVEATLLQIDEVNSGTSADVDAYGRGIDRGLQIAVVTVRKTLTEALA